MGGREPCPHIRRVTDFLRKKMGLLGRIGPALFWTVTPFSVQDVVGLKYGLR